MRSTLVVLGIFVWVLVAFAWLFPHKLALLRKYGMQSTNDDLLSKAAEDPAAARFRRDSRIMMAVGIVGGLLIVFSR